MWVGSWGLWQVQRTNQKTWNVEIVSGSSIWKEWNSMAWSTWSTSGYAKATNQLSPINYHLSIYLSIIYSSIYLPNYPSIHIACIHVYLSNPSSPIYLCLYVFIYLSVYQLIYPCVYVVCHLSIHLPMYLFIHHCMYIMSIHPSIICLFIIIYL